MLMINLGGGDKMACSFGLRCTPFAERHANHGRTLFSQIIGHNRRTVA
eukprot:COSAG02_NODE_916_length_15971_cov_12.781061_11_plen_48_part_00